MGFFLALNALISSKILHNSMPLQVDWVVRDNRPPDNWPHEGRVEIEDLSLRYREELPLALNEVTCHVHGGEKVRDSRFQSHQSNAT